MGIVAAAIPGTMSDKYTAVYQESWMTAGHWREQPRPYTLVRIKRMERKEEETVLDMLIREGIEDCEFLFNGHPTFVGEETNVG